MTLRVRLTLAVLLTAVPLWAGATWLINNLEREALVDAIAESAIARMENGGRELCEQSPEDFGNSPRTRGRGRGRRPPNQGRNPRQRRPMRGRSFDIWAYDRSFVSANRRAPEFPAALRSQMEAGADVAAVWTDLEEGDAVSVAVRMPWWDEGPCPVVMVRRSRPPPPLGFSRLYWAAYVLIGVALFAVVLAAGPIVRRIRRLTDDVRRSAADHYAHGVEVSGRDEIAKLGQAFNEASAQIRDHVDNLEKREQTLRSFVANTTHDVMLPLTVLQGHLTTLRRQLEAGDPGNRETLLSALDETQYMASILHNLGAMAKLEASEPNLRHDPVNLCDLVERAVSRHQALASARNIEINSAVPDQSLELPGDVTLLEQAVSNVIHNAVRYNRDGGHVAVLL